MAKLIGGPAHGVQVDTTYPTVIVPCESRGRYNKWGQRLWSYVGETAVRTIAKSDQQFVSFWSAKYEQHTDGTYRFAPPMTRTAYLHPVGCPDCDEWRRKIKA